METQTRRKPPPPATSTSAHKYLLAYNGICFLLWSIVTLRALALIPTLSLHSKLHGLLDALFPLLKWTQTIALLEIVHAALGLVRASPVTTAMQVSSRILLVWTVLQRYPQIVATTTSWGKETAGSTTGPIAFAGILLAWGITEVIRYGFFVWKTMISDKIPSLLTWLRYNTFFVLYPIGISSECLLMYLALKPAAKEGSSVDVLLKVVLFIYVPGSYILYTHMMAQRRKVLKGKGKLA
ncbi:3-hydroxy acyl-CoA dehydratase [Exophiala aquamarina CBS 119918]|uniref:Very-long-chain (3R)-3-hydroxyacyl-CoA dehydratase n=1 Tax=Exophiala aquamarina CBS 119918 TaxID=1182545 RepID=A0A072P162_9EURO|nr:3-hydroxy acyl-CoA dehydratase [Exophiala aquamarina CBS 119918]KEF53581.1 3-hydroxy acyl-CoA dehydratase [Exophiala aquamarina CBS 119918]